MAQISNILRSSSRLTSSTPSWVKYPATIMSCEMGDEERRWVRCSCWMRSAVSSRPGWGKRAC